MCENGFWKVCEALDCEQRIEILRHLLAIEETVFPSVSKLAETFKISTSAMSVHLKKLSTAGLVAMKRADRCVYYRAFATTPDGVRVIAALRNFFATHPSDERLGLFLSYAHVLSHYRRNAIVRCFSETPGISLKELSLRTDMPPQTADRLWGELGRARIVDMNGQVFPPADEPEATLLAQTIAQTGSHLPITSPDF